jgi:hypothetical protein
MVQTVGALTGVRAPAGGEHARGAASAAATSSTSAGPSQHGVQAHDEQIGARLGSFDAAVTLPRTPLGRLTGGVFDQIGSEKDLVKVKDMGALLYAEKVHQSLLLKPIYKSYEGFTKKIRTAKKILDLVDFNDPRLKDFPDFWVEDLKCLQRPKLRQLAEEAGYTISGLFYKELREYAHSLNTTSQHETKPPERARGSSEFGMSVDPETAKLIREKAKAIVNFKNAAKNDVK